jgi:hypothetical protein
MSLYSEVNKNMKKRNDMGVWVYGCMPSGGGGEKKMHPHKKKDVPGVGAMGMSKGLSLIQFIKKC